jgi:hypothetical protein
MNTPTKMEQGAALATADANPFAAYGNAVCARNIVGKLLKFSKGDFVAGMQDEEVPVGTHLVAVMSELLVGWCKWQDNRPAEQVMGRIADGYTPPKRKDLGDLDEGEWETTDDGQRRDPWAYTNYLILIERKSGEIYTFTTASKGGITAVGELAKAYGKVMRERPDEIPVIELDVGSYAHSNKAYGRIKFPIFKIVRWVEAAPYLATLAAGAAVEPDDAQPKDPAPVAKAVPSTAAPATKAKAATRF